MTVSTWLPVRVLRYLEDEGAVHHTAGNDLHSRGGRCGSILSENLIDGAALLVLEKDHCMALFSPLPLGERLKIWAAVQRLQYQVRHNKVT